MLQGTVLAFFKDRETAPHETLQLGGAALHDIHDSDFSLSGPLLDRMFVFRALNAAAREQWCLAITVAIANATPSIPQPLQPRPSSAKPLSGGTQSSQRNVHQITSAPSSGGAAQVEKAPPKSPPKQMQLMY
jgi:hypothetical protein